MYIIRIHRRGLPIDGQTPAPFLPALIQNRSQRSNTITQALSELTVCRVLHTV